MQDTAVTREIIGILEDYGMSEYIMDKVVEKMTVESEVLLTWE